MSGGAGRKGRNRLRERKSRPCGQLRGRAVICRGIKRENTRPHHMAGGYFPVCGPRMAVRAVIMGLLRG